MGSEPTLEEPPSIVSLIASATEIVCSLGLRQSLIGVSHECDFPLDVKDLPVLSSPKLDPKAPGREIDRRVRELVRDGLSVYDVDVELLEQLRPELIVTQDQCEVCAVSPKDLKDATSLVTLKQTEVCSLHSRSLEDISVDFQRVADAARVPERGAQLAKEFLQRLDDLKNQTAQLAAKPRVACLEWLDPPMLAAGWIAELVEIAGGEPIIVDASKNFSTVDWDQVATLDADIVVVMPCGYDIEQSLKKMQDPTLNRRLNELRATKQGRLYVVDGNAYFNRPGPRLADSAEILAGLIHPNHYPDFLSKYTTAFNRYV